MKKLLEIQKKLITFQKDWLNPHFKSKYLTLDSLLEKLLPICNELDLLIYHHMQDNMVVTTVKDGDQFIQSSFPITDFTNPQKIGSAITYAKRYNLWQIFNIVTDDDDDGNKASEKTKQKYIFGIEQLEKFKNDRNKHKEKLITHEMAIKFIESANYTISSEISTLLRKFYDEKWL